MEGDKEAQVQNNLLLLKFHSRRGGTTIFVPWFRGGFQIKTYHIINGFELVLGKDIAIRLFLIIILILSNFISSFSFALFLT